MRHNAALRHQINTMLGNEGLNWREDVVVRHLLTAMALDQDVGRDRLAAQVRRPLMGPGSGGPLRLPRPLRHRGCHPVRQPPGPDRFRAGRRRDRRPTGRMAPCGWTRCRPAALGEEQPAGPGPDAPQAGRCPRIRRPDDDHGLHLLPAPAGWRAPGTSAPRRGLGRPARGAGIATAGRGFRTAGLRDGRRRVKSDFTFQRNVLLQKRKEGCHGRVHRRLGPGAPPAPAS
ncbi:MAG: hypothetical protein MZV70_29380 [Desulfobacterales bacterium]|nr:hypothetical protein [Desulfobacterales bacterium]